MSFSSRRRNYLLTPHRRDGFIECIKSMLMHSFVLDALDTTGADTFSHFEMLIDEHRTMTNRLIEEIVGNNNNSNSGIAANGPNGGLAIGGGGAIAPLRSIPSGVIVPSRLKRLVPGIGTFYTRLPLRKAFEAYNAKYGITKRRFVCISFNEIRHILNLAQIIAMIHPYSQEGEGSLLLTKFDNFRVMEGEKGGCGSDNRRQHHTPRQQSETDARVLEAWKNMGEGEEDGDDAVASSSAASSCGIHNGSIGNYDGDKKDASIMTKQLTTTSSPRRSSMLDYRDRSESIAIEESLSRLPSTASMPGPKLICFDGDQTLYTDGANFEKSPKLAKYIYLLLKHGVTVAVVTAAGYEYEAPKYELRLSGLLAYFRERGLEGGDLERFYIFGGECNYLLRLGDDYRLRAVREDGPGGWVNSTKYLPECPGNWNESEINSILDKAEACFLTSSVDQSMRATIIRKKRSVGLVPKVDEKIPREALDETVLRIQTELEEAKVSLPFCAFNGGRDAWVDVGNKRVGVQVLQSYLGIPAEETLHIGDQFLLTGNDFAARSVCPCVWITSPEETTYILKTILRLAGVPLMALTNPSTTEEEDAASWRQRSEVGKKVDFEEAGRRTSRFKMNVYTGEYINVNP